MPTFDDLYQQGWQSRSNLFKNKFLESTRVALPKDTRGILKQLIPGHFQSKRQNQISASHSAEANNGNVNSAAQSIRVFTPFDSGKFSFDKAKKEETIAFLGRRKLDVVFPDSGDKFQPRATPNAISSASEQRDSEGTEGKEDDPHALMINLSPVIPFHGLLVPSPEKHIAQSLLHWRHLLLPLEVLCLISEREDARFLFNGLGGWASINHLHFHITYLRDLFPHLNGRFPVECSPRTLVKSFQLPGTSLNLKISRISEWPLNGFSFSLSNYSTSNPAQGLPELAQAATLLTTHLIASNIAHNALFAHTPEPTILIWPRKHQKWLTGVEMEEVIAVAIAELSGLPIFGDDTGFEEFAKAEYDELLGMYCLSGEEMSELQGVVVEKVGELLGGKGGEVGLKN